MPIWLRLFKKVQMLMSRGARNEAYFVVRRIELAAKTTTQMGLFQQPLESYFETSSGCAILPFMADAAATAGLVR